MRRRFGVVLICFAMSGCASPPPAAEQARANVPRDEAHAEAAIEAATAINAFAVDLYGAAPADGNLVYSPASIALALAMARSGAVGRTADEMDAVLHEAASDDHAAWLNALDRELASRNGTFTDANETEHEIALRIANAAFAQQGLALKPAYLDALAARLGAGVQTVDYAADAEAAREAINAWVDDHTESRIPELIAPGILDELTQLTLVNAIYLRAAWVLPFDASATEPGTFTLPSGSTVEVPTMHADEKREYAEGDDWQAVELRYAGPDLSMVVILPKDLQAFEADLSPDLLAQVVAGMEERLLTLALPRFSIESQLDLGDALADLGMSTAFGTGADFSGITDEAQLFIDAVVHQANIDVDELGTEAAAATAAMMPTSGAESATMIVDRPFLFLLRDIPTGAILFLGRVTDPYAGA